MRNPDSLQVSALALDLADAIYTLTDIFPRDHRFELTAQMRRAALSVGSNIYEACGQLTRKAFVHHLGIALGSASELRFQLRFARRRHLAPENELASLDRETCHIIRKLARLIQANRGTHAPWAQATHDASRSEPPCRTRLVENRSRNARERRATPLDNDHSADAHEFGEPD